MKSLREVKPTPEQHKLILSTSPGVRIIRGAAGSGKTTTALLMLRMALGFLLSEKKRTGRSEPIRAVVFTFNRTLAAYVESMAHEALRLVGADPRYVNLEITTLAKYARTHLPRHEILDRAAQDDFIKSKASEVGLDPDFLVGEVEYLLGRFLPTNISDYLDAERTGRGAMPRVEKKLRIEIIEKVIKPYTDFKAQKKVLDWNDLILDLVAKNFSKIDIAVIDEAQDFSANQLRAVVNQLADPSYATFVLDTAQRIYTRGFTWKDVGLEIRPEHTYRLEKNYRNTAEIAALASQLLDEKKLDEDATLPLFSVSDLGNRLPVIFQGTFPEQVSYALGFIRNEVDLSKETVVFLHPKGGGWFSYLKQSLEKGGLPYSVMTRVGEWPDGDEQIALSTIHSAKGLEFDHVFMLGLSDECFIYEEDDDDDDYLRVRRLVAMGITRARKSVTLGYKKETKPSFIDLFKPSTFEIKRA